MYLTQKELAEAFRVDPRTIRNWDGKGLDVARTGPEGKYDLGEAIAWRMDEIAPEDDPYRVALTRRAEAQARKAELELAEAEGAVVPLEIIEESLTHTLSLLRQKIIAVSGAWPTRLAERTAREIQSVLRSELVPELLETLRMVTDELPAAQVEEEAAA